MKIKGKVSMGTGSRAGGNGRSDQVQSKISLRDIADDDQRSSRKRRHVKVSSKSERRHVNVSGEREREHVKVSGEREREHVKVSSEGVRGTWAVNSQLCRGASSTQFIKKMRPRWERTLMSKLGQDRESVQFLMRQAIYMTNHIPSSLAQLGEQTEMNVSGESERESLTAKNVGRFGLRITILSLLPSLCFGAPNIETVDHDPIIQNEKRVGTIKGEDKILPSIEINHPIAEKLMNEGVEKLTIASKPEKRVESLYNDLPKGKQSIIEDSVPVKLSAPKRKRIKKRSGVKIFSRNLKYLRKVETKNFITLPDASTVLTTTLTGLQLSHVHDKTDARVDWAFLGPNRSVVEMTGCRIWLSLAANYTTERLDGRPTNLSCRAPNGQTFTVEIDGIVKDGKDEYKGLKGELLLPGKFKAAGLEFLNFGIQMGGKALATGQVTEQVTSPENSLPIKATNVTGNKDKYILGKALEGGPSQNLLKWFIDFYNNMSPLVAVKPGSKLFITIKGEVKIPKIFFKMKRRRL